MAIDPVTLQVLANHAQAAAEAMAFTLFRTAHSTFVKETEDFTTGLTTPRGQTYASPRDLGATWFVCLDYRNVIEHVERYEEGDIWITSDPYSGFVCTHAPDVHLWKPVFHNGEIVSFAVGHIHNTDVGGAVPASRRFQRKKLDLVMRSAVQNALADRPLWAHRASRSVHRATAPGSVLEGTTDDSDTETSSTRGKKRLPNYTTRQPRDPPGAYT